MLTDSTRYQGQALLELLCGMIALSVVFLGLLLVGDLCRARMDALLNARAEAGVLAMTGTSAGTPLYYGMGDGAERLKSEVLQPMENPVAYSQYTGSGYAYIQENLVQPLYQPDGALISSFNLTVSSRTRYVTNAEFLVKMNVGTPQIPVTQQSCMPLMKDF